MDNFDKQEKNAPTIRELPTHKKNPAFGKIFNKIKKGVNAVILAAGISSLATASMACSPEKADEMCMLTEDENDRPLERFFDNYDIRDIQPLPPEKRGRIMEELKFQPNDIIDMLGSRFNTISGIKLDFNNIFDIQLIEKDQKNFPVLNFKTDLTSLLEELKRLDPNAKIERQSQNKWEFTLNDKKYGFNFETDLLMSINGTDYWWLNYDNPEKPYLWEIHHENNLRHVIALDKSGNSLHRIYEEKTKDLNSNKNEIEKPDELISLKYKTKNDTKEIEIKNVNDIKKLIESLENVNLLEDFRGVKEYILKIIANQNGIFDLIQSLPSNDPSIFQIFTPNQTENCLNPNFISPEQIIKNNSGSEKDYAVLHSLWSRLNGYKTSIYYVNIKLPSPYLPQTGYFVVATDTKNGTSMVLKPGNVIKLQADENLEKIIEKDNAVLSKQGGSAVILEKIDI